MIEHVIVMAASPNRRMEPLTRTRPKAMLPLLGKPLIARVMDSFYRAGIRRFTVVVGEQEGQVAIWLSQRWHPDISLSFAPQGHLRGTAAALFAARSQINEPFIIASCDNLLPQEHVARKLAYFDTHPADVAVLTLFHAPDDIVEASGVLLDPRGHVIYVSEQPTDAHQDFRTALPVYGFTPKVLEYIDRVPVMEQSGERALATAIQMMIDDGHYVGAVETPHRTRLQSPQDLLQATIEMLEKRPAPALFSDIPTSVTINPPVHVDPGVVVGQHVTLGPGVYLEGGSIIGQNTSIREAVILGRHIGPEKTITGEIVKEDRL